MSKVTVVVLGDIGHSPRMQYHALSLAEEGFLVNVVGYRGSDPLDSLSNHPHVKFRYLEDCPDFMKYFSSTLAYVIKTIYLSFALLFALVLTGRSNYILVQNPPAIPALGVCYVYSRLTFSKLIIDWHNYAYTILALSLGCEHRLVSYCRTFEFFFGRKSDANICVTKGMKDDLSMKSITASVMYDRPPNQFRPINIDEKHELINSLGKEYPIFLCSCKSNETIFTDKINKNEAILKKNRPALVISSTSWTVDENFDLLVEALQDYENTKNDGINLPRLIIAITGKGPLKEFYISIMKRRKWQHIDFITPWLKSEDYPKFLACGDLGVSLHSSSSQLDLPMKVVDMFGCGLPVAALTFKCLDELVVDKKNGLVFETSQELGKQLTQWFTNFPDTQNSSFISSIQDNLTEFRSLKWHENWKLNVLPIFTKAMNKSD